MKTTGYILNLLVVMTQLAGSGQTPFSPSELEARRKAALAKVPDGRPLCCSGCFLPQR
jgi:hypothetical protein